MNPGAFARSFFTFFTDLLFPARCVFCQRLGSSFCPACRSQATPIGDHICVRCGAPTPVRCTCNRCQRTPSGSLRGMRGAVFYGGPVAFAIHALKYRGMTALASPLAGYLVGYLEAHPISFACLTPVPLHPARLAHRGYNQSELLAREVSRACKLPLRTDLIMRTRDTAPQVHLNYQQRQENVYDAFAPTGAALLHGERVLLIDDVCTTGATLAACADALHATGAGEVWALAIARAQPPGVKREA